VPPTVIVNPTSGSPVPETGLRVALGDLAGKTVGFFSNNKPNAGALLERVEELLHERFGIAARRYVKAVPSLAADASLLDDIRRDCDAVVVAGFD
jgi:hypothetical protein